MVLPYYGVHVNIVSCERLVFVFVFVFLGGNPLGMMSRVHVLGAHGLRLIVCRLRAFHMISHGKSVERWSRS